MKKYINTGMKHINTGLPVKLTTFNRKWRHSGQFDYSDLLQDRIPFGKRTLV